MVTAIKSLTVDVEYVTVALNAECLIIGVLDDAAARDAFAIAVVKVGLGNEDDGELRPDLSP